MSDDAEKMKRLLTFKKKVETRIEDLDLESKELKTTLEILNSILLEKGFKRPDINIKSPPAKEEAVATDSVARAESEQVPTLLKSDSGETLAELYLDESDGSAHVTLARDKLFNARTPPFNQFLIQRVLLKMQERDGELVKSGHKEF